MAKLLRKPMDHPKTYEFGRFHLEIDQRRLLKDGQPVAIQPKVFDTLAALVERRGRLVEKSELMALLWPDTVVEDINLARNVSDLRRILSDGDNAPGYIETVSKKGYRWTATVEVPERPAMRNWRPWLWIWLVAAMATAVTATAIRGWKPREMAAARGRKADRPNPGTPGLLGTEVTQN
jgi:DNA-binding winged helix-turn-helix (wHTH) protein